MKHRVFTILSALSLVACVASGAMWVRSNHHGDSVALLMPYHEATIFSASGGVYFEWLLLTFQQQEWRIRYGLGTAAPQSGLRVRTDLNRVIYDETDPERDWGKTKLMGFWWREHDSAWNSESPPMLSGWQVGVPYWAIILLTLIAPVRSGIYWHRNRRHNLEGLCPTCGYDLRASLDRCPECGTPILAAVARRPVA